jgi:hypothetical protein
MKNTVLLIFSVIGVLLGGLWLFQGLGILHMEPILYFEGCEPLQGPSTTWAVIGLLVLAGGTFGIVRWFKRRG